MAKKLIVFGEYIGYQCGGAEKSMHSLIAHFKNIDIEAISANNKEYEIAPIQSERIKITKVNMCRIKQFPYMQYFINSLIMAKKISNISSDGLLFAQGMEAPMVINGYKGDTVYFIRNEKSLNICKCYEKNMFKILKFIIRHIIEIPFIIYYFYENKKAIKKSKLIIANSNYIAERVKKIFKRNSVVVYPTIEICKNVNKIVQNNQKKYIMMIGDCEAKGVGVFKKIAAQMPNYKFMITGKYYKNTTIGNIRYRSYVTDYAELYSQAKILLVPSVWEEAFGRVSVEAQSFGVPAIVSNRGGLPETVISEEYVIDKY